MDNMLLTSMNQEAAESMTTLAVEKILPARPFLHGMVTAFDLYGARGAKAIGRIYKEWDIASVEPLPSADESIRDSIATIKRDYLKLLSEQAK